jgi:hypothetical protein
VPMPDKMIGVALSVNAAPLSAFCRLIDVTIQEFQDDLTCEKKFSSSASSTDRTRYNDLRALAQRTLFNE